MLSTCIFYYSITYCTSMLNFVIKPCLDQHASKFGDRILLSCIIMLSDSESDGEAENQFTINEHYAKAFHYRKEREELEKRA